MHQSQLTIKNQAQVTVFDSNVNKTYSFPVACNEQLSKQYYQSLPYFPYCSDDLVYGIIKRSRHFAATKKYIQHNPENIVSTIIVDIDRNDAVDHFDFCNAPTPNLVMINMDNGKGHYAYLLNNPVYTYESSSRKAISYLNKIQRGLVTKLGGDADYTQFISKNPLSGIFNVYTPAVEPYGLDELAEFTDLDLPKQRKREKNGHGRNCHLFDETRYWAYPRVNQYRENSTREHWERDVLEFTTRRNTFEAPLHCREIGYIAKSVANWTWDKYIYSPKVKRGRDAAKFSTHNTLTQKEKQVLAAINTNRDRKEETELKIKWAVEKLTKERKKITQAAVSKLIGVSTRTVRKYWSEINQNRKYGVYQITKP